MVQVNKAFKIFSIIICILLSICCMTSCNTDENTVSIDPIQEARTNVVNKWKNDQGKSGTTKYIEDIYKKYPNDEVISNIYFYSIAKEEYDNYKSLNDDKYLKIAKEYASKIDSSYSGEFSNEIQSFANEILGNSRDEEYSSAKESEDRYNNLTNAEKKEICNFIQSRYDYYDSISGGKYTGDKYTDVIWKEAEEKYGLTETQIDIIWMDMYKY